MEKEQLRDGFLSHLKYKANNTRKLFLIGFVGVTGVGKSYISEKLSGIIKIPVTANDQIRRFLEKRNYGGNLPPEKLLNYIAEERTTYLLKNRVSHIIDADLLLFYQVAKKNACKYGADLLLIKIKTPRAEILKRIKERQNKNNSISKAGLDTFAAREKLHQTTPLSTDIFYTLVNTGTEQITTQLREIVKKLSDSGYI